MTYAETQVITSVAYGAENEKANEIHKEEHGKEEERNEPQINQP